MCLNIDINIAPVNVCIDSELTKYFEFWKDPAYFLLINIL